DDAGGRVDHEADGAAGVGDDDHLAGAGEVVEVGGRVAVGAGVDVVASEVVGAVELGDDVEAAVEPPLVDAILDAGDAAVLGVIDVVDGGGTNRRRIETSEVVVVQRDAGSTRPLEAQQLA